MSDKQTLADWFAPDPDIAPTQMAQILARRAAALAAVPEAELVGTRLELLTFLMGGEKYGIEVTSVQEIYALPDMTPVPRTPPFVVGLFNARGRLISVVDLRAFFGLSNMSITNDSQIIIATTGDENEVEVGLLADEVLDVTTVFVEDLEPAFTTQRGARAQFSRGIAPGMIIVLNIKPLLRDKQLIIHEELI